MANQQNQYDFTSTQEGYYNWYKVVKSWAGPPSEKYLESVPANRRAGLMQWHRELEPLSYKYANGGNKTDSINLPNVGQAPQKESPLVVAIADYAKFGIIIKNENDFPLIEGHIFYMHEYSRKCGRTDKYGCWAEVMNDLYVPPLDVPILGDAGGSGAAVNVWELVVNTFAGKKVKSNEMALVMGTGNPAIIAHQEITTLMNMGKLGETLVEKGLLTVNGDSYAAVGSE